LGLLCKSVPTFCWLITFMQNKVWNPIYAFLPDLDMIDPIRHIRFHLLNDDLKEHRRKLFDIFYGAITSSRFFEIDVDDMQEYAFTFEKTVEILEAACRIVEMVEKGKMQVQIKAE
jgi:hypothetical protein